MSTQDYLILLVGLGVIAWMFRRQLARMWNFPTAARDDESRMRVWRLWILLGTIFVPPVGVAISNILTQYSLNFSNTIESSIDSISGFAWIVYAAWISKPQGRWIGIAKWGLIVLSARALTLLASYLTTNYPQELFWEFKGLEFKHEAVHLFVALIILMIGGRIVRLHMVPANQNELEPPRITIPFLMLMQALLALAISLMFWVIKSSPEGTTQVSPTIQLLMLFCFCLSTVLFAFAILLPSQIPRWALVSTLAIGAVGLRLMLLFLWYRDMRLDDDPQTVQTADGMLYIVSWQMAVQSVLILGAFVLIRFLFRKAGLVIVRAGIPKPTTTQSIYG